MNWRCGRYLLDCGRPRLMGVVNVTPDSFSDGGQCFDAAAAVRHGLALAAAGADLVDVGAESTRPGAAPVSAEEEKRRLLPVVQELAAAGVVVSADTMKPEVMQAALSAGASVINDVNGFCSADAVAAVADADCGVVIMHKRGDPATMQTAPHYADVVAEVEEFLRTQAAALQAAGVVADRMCLDPGIGFGKTRAHNVALLNHLPRLGGGMPVLVGVSRKSLFAGVVAEEQTPADRDAVSAVAAALLVPRGASVLRVHNVAMTKEALAVVELLAAETVDG